tara:strand:+ start:351 stop:692 length:342 start_codon:yes stop_codon:yes gene_type:complete
MDPNNSQIRIKKFYPPPPIIGTYYEYIDVNKDKNLRKLVTTFFHKKVIKWTNQYSEFSHLKKHINKLKSSDGYSLIYNLIRKFVKDYNINWYDIRDNYPTFKDFLRIQIPKYI